MLTQLCANHSIPNFHFRTSELKPYSTIRHIGTIDMDNLIRDADMHTLAFSAEGLKKFSSAQSTDNGSPYLKVRLTIDKGKRARQLGLISDRLTIADVSSNTDKSFSKRDLDLELNTMPDRGLIDSRHWLDSGSVKK